MTASADHQIRRPRRALHPPLTDFPIAAYVFAATFDVISAVGGQRHSWAREFWHAGTFVLVAGAVICILVVLTGFRDLLAFSSQDSLPVQTISLHVCVMVSVFMIGVGDIAWRLRDYQSLSYTPPGVLACSLAAAIGVCAGAACGGSLVFRHGVGILPPAGQLGAVQQSASGAQAAPAGLPAQAGDTPASGTSASPAAGRSPAATDLPARHRPRRDR